MIKNKFEKFTSRLGMYNGLLFQTKVHFDKILKSEKELTEKWEEDFVRPLLGSNFNYRNPLTAEYEFKYRHLVHQDNLAESVQLLKENYFNFVIAQCYETFESFLKDIVSAYLFNNPEIVIQLKDKIDNGSFDKCRESIRKLSRSNNQNNKRLFKLIYQLNPEIKNYEKNNLMKINYSEWNLVLVSVRHSIVHGNSLLKKETILSWTPWQKVVLKQFFAKEIENEEIILSTVDSYDNIIRTIAQHGQILFEGLNKKMAVSDQRG